MIAFVFAPLICAILVLSQQFAFRLYVDWRKARARRRWNADLNSPVLQEASSFQDEALAYLAAVLPGLAGAVYRESPEGGLRILHQKRRVATDGDSVVRDCFDLLQNKSEIQRWLSALAERDLDSALIEDAFSAGRGAENARRLRSIFWPWKYERERVGMYFVRIPMPHRDATIANEAAPTTSAIWAVGLYDPCAYIPPGHLLQESIAAIFEPTPAPVSRTNAGNAPPRFSTPNATPGDQHRDVLPADSDARLSRVIHDVRLPLTRLFAMLENLQDRVQARLPSRSASHVANEADEDDIERGFARIARQLRTMESFTYDILNVESGGAVDGEYEATVLNVADRIRQIVDAHLDLIRRKNITVIYEFAASETEASIFARSMALDRILFNLLTNSFQFCSSPGQIHIGLSRRSRHLLLEIEDSGPGLVSQENAFELSRRNIGRGGSGWGIGLASARDLSRRLGGRLVSARPRHGKGARFLLVLPGVPVQSGTR